MRITEVREPDTGKLEDRNSVLISAKRTDVFTLYYYDACGLNTISLY
jgi:hypothetical protein